MSKTSSSTMTFKGNTRKICLHKGGWNRYGTIAYECEQAPAKTEKFIRWIPAGLEDEFVYFFTTFNLTERKANGL